METYLTGTLNRRSQFQSGCGGRSKRPCSLRVPEEAITAGISVLRLVKIPTDTQPPVTVSAREYLKYEITC